MLRLYANENMELPVIEALRSAGHDVAIAAEDGIGRDDDEVLRSATALGRVVVTHDKDYGTLIFRDAARGVSGILLLRLSARSVDELASMVVVRVAKIEDKTHGHFVVISDKGTRMIRLPTTK